MMISGSSLVFFLFLVPVSTGTMKECGKNKEITTRRVTSKISNVRLTNVHQNDSIFSINETYESYCTENGKFCIQFGEDRRQITLTVHNVTFEDQGTYALRYEHDVIDTDTFYIEVTGMCEPKLSSSTDNLTCEIDVENPSITTIVWRDKDRNMYKIETDPENVTVTKLRGTFKLTNETRKVDICCTVSLEGKKEEKQICQNPSRPGGPDKLEGTDNDKKMIIIPILLVLVLAICVTLYLLRRRRMSFTQKSREDHQAENLEGAPLELLQRPQDQV